MIGLRVFYVTLVIVWMAGIVFFLQKAAEPEPLPVPRDTVPFAKFFTEHLLRTLPINDGLDFPLRPKDGDGVFIATPFTRKDSLGENWNTALGNGDLGEPVYSIGEGWVTLAVDFQSSYGNVVIIVYRMPDTQFPPCIEVMYAHLGRIDVKPFEMVTRGQQIGTIGNVDGLYNAHLHWEVRQALGLGLGGGTSDDKDGWLEPSEFIKAHRPPGSPPAKMKVVPEKDEMKWGSDM